MLHDAYPNEFLALVIVIIIEQRRKVELIRRYHYQYHAEQDLISFAKGFQMFITPDGGNREALKIEDKATAEERAEGLRKLADEEKRRKEADEAQ